MFDAAMATFALPIPILRFRQLDNIKGRGEDLQRLTRRRGYWWGCDSLPLTHDNDLERGSDRNH